MKKLLSRELFSAVVGAVKDFFIEILDGMKRFDKNTAIESQARFTQEVWDGIQAEDPETFNSALTAAVPLAARSAAYEVKNAIKDGKLSQEDGVSYFHRLVGLLIDVGVLVQADAEVRQEKPFLKYSGKLYVPAVRGEAKQGKLSGKTVKQNSWQEDTVYTVFGIQNLLWPRDAETVSSQPTGNEHAPTLGDAFAEELSKFGGDEN